MPIKVTDLEPGDRVLLNAPKSRTATHREAIFMGLAPSALALMKDASIFIAAGEALTVEFLDSSRCWAGFQFFIGDAGTKFCCGFAVDPDGSLRDDSGMRVFIERRLGRTAVG